MSDRISGHRRTRVAYGFSIAWVLIAGTAALAVPHLRLEASDPADGSDLPAWPIAITLEFSEEVRAEDASASTSARRGAAGQSDAAAGLENPANSLWQVLVRFGSFGATLAVFGVVGLLLFVVPATGELAKDLTSSLRKLGLIVATAQVIGVFARLFAQTSLLRGVFGEMSVGDVALSSWGTLLLIQAVGGLLVGVAFTWGGRMMLSLAAFGAVVLALVFPWVGHAAGGGALQGVVDSVHIASSGVWIGGLGAMLALLVPLQGWTRSHERVAVLLPRFARTAMVVAPVSVLTGVLNAWFHAPAVSRWLTEPYGQLLGAKIAVVGLLLALGAVHHHRLTPLAGTHRAAPRLLRTGTLELVLAVSVVLLTAALVATAMD